MDGPLEELTDVELKRWAQHIKRVTFRMTKDAGLVLLHVEVDVDMSD